MYLFNEQLIRKHTEGSGRALIKGSLLSRNLLGTTKVNYEKCGLKYSACRLRFGRNSFRI